MDPRVARSRTKIFEAVLELLGDGGWDALTIEGVAARAGVGKTTIYRHWDSKAGLVRDALEAGKVDLPAVDTGELRGDLLEILGRLADRFASGEPARILPALIAAAEVDEELERMHRDFVADRRRPLKGALQRAVDRGELPEEVDVDVAADMLSGPLFFRRFITREPVSRAFVEQLVDTLLPRLESIRGKAHSGRRSGPRGHRGKMHGSHRRTGSPRD